MMKQRNPMLDLFRMVIMFMITLGHALVHGGGTPDLFTPAYYTTNTLIMFLYVHVDCFIIMSGYLGADKNFKCSKWLRLWGQMLFWSLVLFFLCSAIESNFQIKELVKSIMPFTQQRYWFMTAYLLMYLLTPLLNKLIQAMKKNEYRRSLIVYFAIYILLQNLIAWREFTAVNSLSPLFFCFLYMLGGYFRKYPPERKIKWPLIYILSCIIRCVYFFGASAITVRTFGEPLGETLLNGYTSFLVIIGAVALFMTFATAEIRFRERSAKLLAFVSPLMLGVYLIHDNPSLREPLWDVLNLARFINTWYLIPMCMLSSIVIFSVCIVLEWCRVKIFSVCKIDWLLTAAGEKIDRALDGEHKRLI